MKKWIFLLLVLLFSGCYPGVKPAGKTIHVTIYNPATVTVIQGKIVGKRIVRMDGENYVVIIVGKKGRKIPVYIAPLWWVNKNRWMFREGVKVKITGSSALLKGENIILAREIYSEPLTFIIRDESGHPLWVKVKVKKKHGKGKKKGRDGGLNY